MKFGSASPRKQRLATDVVVIVVVVVPVDVAVVFVNVVVVEKRLSSLRVAVVVESGRRC